jgi:hypothetical protein
MRSAAVKVSALLTLRQPQGLALRRGWQRLFYAALLSERPFEQLCRFHKRLDHALL